MTFDISSNHKNNYLKVNFQLQLYNILNNFIIIYITWSTLIGYRMKIQFHHISVLRAILFLYRSDKYASNNLVYKMFFEVIEIEQFQRLVLMKSSNNDDLSAVYLPNQ